MMYDRELVEEDPCCSECGNGPLVFVKDDMCNIMDASTGTITCEACGFVERGMYFWMKEYKGLRHEPSELQKKMRMDREHKAAQRMAANERWAKEHPAPEGWSYLFRFSTNRGTQLLVNIDGHETVATFPGSTVIEVNNRRYVSAKLDPSIPFEGGMSDDLEIDERFPAKEIEKSP